MIILKVLYSSIVQPWSYESSAASECWHLMPNFQAMLGLRCVSWQTAAFGAPRRVSGDCQAGSSVGKVCQKLASVINQSLNHLRWRRAFHSGWLRCRANCQSNLWGSTEFQGRPFRRCSFQSGLRKLFSQECCSGRTGATEAVQVVPWVIFCWIKNTFFAQVPSMFYF